jgi:tetratricopeptide (TPR) repeat protein
VVTGFGKKTAYTRDHKPRVLDLDATYESIIEPAVTGAGLRCIRADKMLNAGMIDSRMYEMLLRADLVIADISTGNVNAVYELGVRHALRPYTTILMQEDEAAFYFDLSHSSTFVYHHLGDDIGSREAKEKREALKALIVKIMERPMRDSPVYEFLRDLQPPALPEAAFKAMLTVIEEQGDRLAEVIREGKEAMKRSDFSSAVESFELAHKIVSRKSTDDEAAAGQSELDFVVQQLALATYKGKLPSEKEALQKALTIIAKLNPDSSHDIETLGIAGAIRKRLWILELQRTHLDKAIEYYGQGFNLRKDYYNGENYALCLDLRSDLQQDADDRLYDRMTARRVRKEIVEHLGRELTAADYADRPDKLWMNATMANALFALGRSEEAQFYEQAFMDLGPRDWQRDTYEDGKQMVLAQLNC